MKAIVQGEFHTSKSDIQALKSHVTEEVDALFIEGREDAVKPEKWTIGYVFFVTGTSLIFWIQDLVDRDDPEDFGDIPVYDEIDTSLPILHQRISKMGRMSVSMLCGAVLLFGLILPFFPVPFIPVPNSVVILNTIVVKLLIVAFVPVLYSFLIILIEERYIGGRDDDMVGAIDEISRENGHDTVVVSCGESHVNGITDRLEEKGWEVEPHYSDTVTVQVWRRIS